MVYPESEFLRGLQKLGVPLVPPAQLFPQAPQLDEELLDLGTAWVPCTDQLVALLGKQRETDEKVFRGPFTLTCGENWRLLGDGAIPSSLTSPQQQMLPAAPLEEAGHEAGLGLLSSPPQSGSCCLRCPVPERTGTSWRPPAPHSWRWNTPSWRCARRPSARTTSEDKGNVDIEGGRSWRPLVFCFHCCWVTLSADAVNFWSCA